MRPLHGDHQRNADVHRVSARPRPRERPAAAAAPGQEILRHRGPPAHR